MSLESATEKQIWSTGTYLEAWFIGRCFDNEWRKSKAICGGNRGFSSAVRHRMPFDDVRWQADMARGAGSGIALCKHGFDHQPGRFAGHIADRLVNGREFRPDLGRQRRIVKAADGKVARYFNPPPVRHRDNSGSHVIVAGKDRRRPLRMIEQGVCR